MASTSTPHSPTVLVLGASGMLGHALMNEFGASGLDVHGTLRSINGLPAAFIENFGDRLCAGVDVRNRDQLATVLERVAPDIVVNAVGVIKQAPTVRSKTLTAEVNALLPHVLADECTERGARLIQISTDCVFSGRTGGYTEEDVPDPVDFYGRSKLLGEVEAPHITLRTSIIGPEIRQRASLVEWFLSQSGGEVRGYTRAIYSGLPTVELGRVITDVVIPRPKLDGLWHLASAPISKYDLLRLVGSEYSWEGRIVPDDELSLDRSMSAARFAAETGYVAPPWTDLVRAMRDAQSRWAG